MQRYPLGDSAILWEYPTEAQAARVAQRVQAINPPWLDNAVPAYRRLGLFFDPNQITADQVHDWLQSLDIPDATSTPGRTYTIPICYERGPDLTAIAEQRMLTCEQVIALHSSTLYTVHALGFVPGFPYLGYLPEPLAGVTRLPSPRLRVEPGSVGVAGRQTGIYPLPRPGGWPLLGQTPLTIVEPHTGYFPLEVGDQIAWKRIDEQEYRDIQGTRLTEWFDSHPR